ncbi:putative eukaryotic ribosomal protein P1 P2 family protein [Lyophyllum shimeji]|uniref:Eukaryotic ribosomal protein P1 P2 family protein n=1 Tax=Lyophyllum shimeji TaxID=47721 RepID=A0A9P3PV08_LYOSH|nr:putative eukaryotic ribosomal protein P1 P2 family protein [Lyophyllum shimeji]
MWRKRGTDWYFVPVICGYRTLKLPYIQNASSCCLPAPPNRSTVGIEADDNRLDTLISELKGKAINDLISEGSSKLASVPAGGAGGAAAAAPAAGGAAPAAAAEEKKEEKAEEKEESDEDMGFGLFD